MIKKTKLTKIVQHLLFVFPLTIVINSSYAAPLNLATKPLFVSTAVAPNLTLLLDDSGSMALAYVPDSMSNALNTRRIQSAYYNALAYDPNTSYKLPVKSDGSNYNTSFTTAYINGFDTSRGSINLSNSYRSVYNYIPSNTSQSFNTNPSADFGSGNANTGQIAYYYIRDNSLTGCVSTNDADEKCYKRVFVNTNSGVGGSDERQNFANWYSFYRTRNLAIVSGASLALQNLDPAVRLSWTSLNTCTGFNTACKGWDGVSQDNRIRAFTGNQKDSFYSWVTRLPASGGTPLRNGLIRIGDYYKTSGINSPYAQNPQLSAGIESSCRQNYALVMTDGIWNSDSPSLGNKDNTAVTLPDGNNYSPISPYKDNNTTSLADIAFYYWASDLRPTLANSVSPYKVDYTGTVSQQYWNPKNDPANWQHMVTFTVGLGLSDWLGAVNLNWQGNTYSGDYNNLVSGTKTWPATGADASGNIADLWHAALNGRGQFFSADNPEQIINAFQSVVARVNTGIGASGSVTANTTNIRNGTNIYQARFNSTDWSGDLLSVPLQTDGTLPSDLLVSSNWRSGNVINNTLANNRIILTNKTSLNKGIPFRWPSNPTSPGINEIDATQATSLQINPDTFNNDNKGLQRLNFIRGDKTNENVFRTRNTLLGDIVNSSPLLVYPPSNLNTDSSYRAFKSTYANRKTILYVGANDGMLHGFDINNGKELLAYVPSAVYNKLNKLTSPTYGHQFYVDGLLDYNDVKFSDNTWHTMLVSTMGAGGRGIFGIDVTNPTNFTEANAATIAKFEFTDAQDSDVGYIPGTATITKMNNGKYAAVFGNGYNSTGTGQSTLFIVDIQTGTLIKKISTGSGSTGTPNALSSPSIIDIDGNGTADYIYAGDLQGKMWKFDLTDSTTSNWKIAYNGNPLFIAPQPITEQPEITIHPTNGYMIYFGTGKYVEPLDSSNTNSNNFYGLWDNGLSVISGINQLQSQTVTSIAAYNGLPYRTVSNNIVDYVSKRGWYLALPETGERSITDPILRGGKIIFTTTTPNTDACLFGGTSWLMEMDYLNGGKTQSPIFDTDNNGKIDSNDAIVNGLGLNAISSSPNLLQGLGNSNLPLERIYLNQSNGLITSTLQSGNKLTSRRNSWRQILKK